MTQEQLDAFANKIKAEVGDMTNVEPKITEAMDSVKAEMTAMLEKGASKDDLKAFEESTTKSLEAISDTIKAFDMQKNGSKDLIAEQVDALFADKDKLQAIYRGDAKASFDINAAADTITTGNVSTTATRYDGRSFEIDTNISYLARKSPLYKQLFDLRSTSSAVIHYWDEVAGEGGATFLAENAEKQKKDYDMVIKSSEAKKVAKIVPMTEELITDSAEMYDAIKQLVTVDLDIVIDNDIFYGDTGVNPNTVVGLTKIAGIGFPDPSSFDDSVTSPQTANAILCAIGEIANAGEGSKFMANKVAINIVDYFGIFNEANGQNYTNNPLISVLGGRIFVGGVELIPSNRITSGYMLVIDTAIANIRPYGGVRVDMGFASGDFENNRISMRAEQRLHSYVKTNDQGGMIYDAIADVKSQIELSAG